MKKKLNFLGLLLVILLSLFQYNCNSEDVSIGDIKKIKLGKINSDNISLTVNVPVVNPNFFKIKITEYDLTIKINNQSFKLAENKKNIVIPRKYRGTIPFSIKLKSQKVFSLNTIRALYKLFKSKKAEIEVLGTIKVRVLLIPKKIQVKEKRTVSFN